MTREPGRSVIDVVADTSAVLRAIEADRCLVAGWSGGGPHALACAARLDAAAAALVIASVAPYPAPGLDWMEGMVAGNATEFTAAIEGEVQLRQYLEGPREHLKDISAEGLMSSLGAVLADVDRAVLTNEFAEDMAAGAREALRTGLEGWLDDDLALTKPWGFSLDEISVPTMVWHGIADDRVPFGHGQWLSSHLRQASIHFEQGEGHLSVALGAIDRMLDELVGAGREI